SEPQICYCGHSACKGIIGGQQKTVINISNGDDDDVIDEEEEKLTAKPRRTRSGSDDEDFDGGQRYDERGLQTVEAVQSFVKLMLYSTAKPTKLIRLLQKLELTQNPVMQRKFLQYHGLPVLKATLAHHCKSNPSICYQTLRILKNMPPVSRNSIVDSGIENIVTKLADAEFSPPSVTESAQEIQPSSSVTQDPNTNNAGTANALKRSPDNYTDAKPTNNPSVFSAADLFNKRIKHTDGNQPQRANSITSSDNDSSNRLEARTASNSSLPPRPSPLVSGMQRLGSGNSSTAFDPSSMLRPLRPYIPGSSFADSPSGGPSGGRFPIVTYVLDSLPNGWKAAKTDEGRIYYYCHATQESRWDFPRDVVSAAESSPGEGTSVGSGGTGGGTTAVVPEVKIKSSMIEGLDEAAIDAIVQRANAGSLKSPADEESGVKALRAMISELVVKTLSRYKEILGSDGFKKVARSCTHDLLEREIRHKTQNNHANGLNDKTKAVMKKFAHKFYKSYMDKKSKKK
ncbi:UNVERIFIED_CONTAM: Histone-lysine N-methyltransferase setd2, partial [Siphonaria sp. JEL0065]